MGGGMKRFGKHIAGVFLVSSAIAFSLLINSCPNSMLDAVKQEVEAYQQGKMEETEVPLPQLLSPSDGSAISDATPLLDWEDVSGASGYHLQVNDAEDFTGSMIVDDNYLADSQYQVTIPLENGKTCYWRVKVKNADGVWGNWSSTWSFTVDTTPPTFSGLSSVTATSSTSITLTWTAATDNVTPQANIVYNVYMSTSSGGQNFETPDNTTTAGSTSYEVANLTPNTIYYFVVRARDEADNWDNNTVEKYGAITYWAKTYGGSNHEEGHSIHQTTNGGYIVGGETTTFSAGLDDFWLLKLDSNGTISWQKTYGGSSSERPGLLIQQTSDGGYIVAGKTASFGAGNEDFWLLKLTSDGTISWQKTYGGSGLDRASPIQQTNDGGYIVAGFTTSFGAGGYDFWLLKLTSDGTISWQKTYGGTNDDKVSSVQQTSDGGYIVAGFTTSFGVGLDELWLLKLDSNGTISWQKTYGGTNDDSPSSVEETSDGGYIVAGRTKSFGVGDYDAWIIKLTSDGTIEWQKTYGGANYDHACSIQQTKDEGYIVACYTASFGAGDHDFWLLKLTSDGTVNWQKTYGGPNYEQAMFVRETTGGGYIVTGQVGSFGAGDYDLWLLKLTPDGDCGNLGNNTNASVSTTYASVSSTSVSAVNTSATVTNTTVTGSDTNCTVIQQEP